MGMRTIRWRNGQWAERIAHAGSEAVRLVPFSSLPAVILVLSSERIPCLSMALAAVPRCGTHHDIVALAAYGGRRCRIWSSEAADRSMVAEGGWKTVRSIGEAFLAVFGPLRGSSMH